MPRPSARAQPQPPRDVAAEQRARVDALRAASARHELRMRAIFDDLPDSEWYCVEAAECVGCSVGQARCILDRLQSQGFLSSRLCPSPVSGNPRRYYKRIGAG